MTFNKKRPHIVAGSPKNGDLIQTHEKSALSLDKVTDRLEPVSNSKVYTSEAESDNMSIIEKDNLLKLKLPYISVEVNTPHNNILDRRTFSLILPIQSTQVSK